jgi:type I restriction-modification system DNA methylase subunit
MSDAVPKNKVKLDAVLWQLRQLCRKNNIQTSGNQSLVNQIYQDLLFIYHIPNLCESGHLELDTAYIGDGKLTEISYKSLLSLKEPTLINTAFKRLWKQLQNCILKPLFEGRDFVMFAIEKKDAKKYMALLLDIMTYLASIEIEKYDSNAGYTYFKKELNKAIAKTFGQFYTPSTVTASVVKQVDPKTGESVLDPSSGSCSFLAEAANHIAKSEGVDMAVAFKDLYGTEVEPNIYAEGVMNMFINFGIIPDMNERIREVDALLDMATNTILFKKIVANPPFGADARSFLEFYYQTVIKPPSGKAKKGTKKVVLNSEVKCEIPFPKISESAILFFQYIIQKLAPGGKAGVVMSATIFNDGFKDMMKWFLECCSLEKVIINPAGTFKEQGTGIETFSFIFTKGSPTTKVEIVMLGTEDVVVRSLTLDQIKEAGWKLQINQAEILEENTSFPYDTIGNLFNFEPGTVAASSAIPGEFPFMTLDDTATHNTSAYDGENAFISKIPSGTGNTFTPKLRYSNTKVNASSLMLRLVPKSDKVLLKYFYYFWKHKTVEYLRTFYKGAANKSLDQDKFAHFRFPIPSLIIQKEIVESIDIIYNNSSIAKAIISSPLDIQNRILSILNEREADSKTLEQMAAKAEQRAKYILDGYLSQAAANPTPHVEPAAVPQNTLIAPTPEPTESAQQDPKPAKKVIKLKKSIAPPTDSD